LASDGLFSCVAKSDPSDQCELIAGLLKSPCVLKKTPYPAVGNSSSLIALASQMCSTSNGCFARAFVPVESDDVVCVIIQLAHESPPTTPKTSQAVNYKPPVSVEFRYDYDTPSTPLLD
jgi:hypothetical protein